MFAVAERVKKDASRKDQERWLAIASAITPEGERFAGKVKVVLI